MLMLIALAIVDVCMSSVSIPASAYLILAVIALILE